MSSATIDGAERLLLGEVHWIDPDPLVSRLLQPMEHESDLLIRNYRSAEHFLRSSTALPRGCIVTEFDLPGMTGLSLQHELARRGWLIPIVVTSPRATVSMAVEVMESGAISLLEKPLGLQACVQTLVKAFRRAEQFEVRDGYRRFARQKLSRLTAKEREVFDLIVAGRSNKEMAARLHLSVRAVEDRRARLKKKLDVQAPAEFGKLARDAEF